MNYEEAKELAIEHGVKIARKSWSPLQYYYVECVRLGGKWEDFLAMTETKVPVKYPYTPDEDDTEASDWTLYKDPKRKEVTKR